MTALPTQPSSHPNHNYHHHPIATLPTTTVSSQDEEEAQQRAEVLATDEAIRAAYGLRRGEGASVLQVDTLVAALASAMVLLRRHEEEEGR